MDHINCFSQRFIIKLRCEYGKESASKNIKFKNKKLFHNKPLVEWSIIASIKSKYIDL